MSKESWDIFLGTKKRTTKSWYSLHKLCSVCSIPIVNDNESGLCRQCTNREKEPGFSISDRQGESEEHKLLKEQARKFLLARGFTNIKEEYLVKANGHPFRNIVFDVVGFKGDKMVAVECGENKSDKLVKAIELLGSLYILPFGKTIPYFLCQLDN